MKIALRLRRVSRFLLALALPIGTIASACSTAERLERSPGVFKPPSATTRAATAELSEEFAAGAEELYRLGSGDEVTVEVWDHPELSGRHMVGPDGRITVPASGPLAVAGASREEATSRVAEALSRQFRDLVVTVRIEKYVSQRVFVLGRVTHPGAVEFEGDMTLLETIARAGGLPVGGSGAEKAALTRCALFRGRDRVLWVDLAGLLNGTNLTQNVRLKRNDVVYIPDSDDQMVYALGEVQHPGAFRMTPAMTLFDLLAQAGGPTEDGRASEIWIVRPAEHSRRQFALSSLLDPAQPLNVALAEGDVLYVPRRGLANVGYVLNRLNPVTGMLLFGATLGGHE